MKKWCTGNPLNEWRACCILLGKPQPYLLPWNFLETTCFQMTIPSLHSSLSPPSLSAGNLASSPILLESFKQPEELSHHTHLHTLLSWAFLPIMAFGWLVDLPLWADSSSWTVFRYFQLSKGMLSLSCILKISIFQSLTCCFFHLIKQHSWPHFPWTTIPFLYLHL